VAMATRELVARLVPDNQELLIDAYCGAGFFARAVLDKVQQVIGIDWDKFAIEAAKEEATEKETYIAGDVEEELRKALVEAVHRTARERQSGPDRLGSIAPTSEFDATTATTLIVDPPATGLTAKVRQTILNLSPATMIYISCNPATLARDLIELQQKFKIESVTPLDMFPQTAEIEVVAHLQRVD
jgi:23S rRNA (uracil1939-C5)-methyltransferase